MKKWCLHPKSFTNTKQIETIKQKLQKAMDDLLTSSLICKVSQHLLLPEARQQITKNYPSADQP